MERLENPVDDVNRPTVTEELLLIIEEFADYIDKFMFEIVTFLAVIDSSMGLIKDVLGMLGFAGWKMTFFPSFSFVVTAGVFLFGSKKRKGKRQAQAAELEGLGEAMEVVEDVLEAVDDVMDEIEGDPEALGLGDYSDSEDNDDRNALKDGISVLDETPGTDDAVDKINVVSDENNQEVSQQDDNVETEPPKSTVQRVIGIAILAARIASKLAKKKQQEQGNDHQLNGDNVQGKSGDCATTHEIGGESMTGTIVPPTVDKSNQNNDTRNQCGTGMFRLEEDKLELVNEASGLVKAAKEDRTKAARLVSVTSLDASNLAQWSTKKALSSTGTLKAGHGLYREADFITGLLNKEGKLITKSLEKETVEKTRQLKDNKIVKATRVEKVGTAVAREATFIPSHSREEAKKESKKVTEFVKEGSFGRGNLVQGSTKHVLASTGAQRFGHGLYREADFISGRLNKEREAITKSVEKETVEKTQQLKDNDIFKATGAENVGTAVSRDVTFIASYSNQEALKLLDYKYLDKRLEPKIKKDKLGPKTDLQANPSHPALEVTRQEEPKRKTNKVSVTDISKQPNKTKGSKISLSHDLTYVVSSEIISAVEEGKKYDRISTCESEESQDPECLMREPLPLTPDMASNVLEGTSWNVGDAASSQAKQGSRQTQKKSKGLLQIVMRLVRLIMRVSKKRCNSTASSQTSSRRDSTVSGSGSLASGGPEKSKRSSSGLGEGSAAAMAGAASAMGSIGSRGGKLGTVIAIIMTLVRLFSKLKGWQKQPSSSDMRASKESMDLESDSEFYDCHEEFPTQEIQTQTDDSISLLSVATQTTETDHGRMWTLASRDSAKASHIRIGESSDKDSVRSTYYIQAAAGQNINNLAASKTRGQGEMESSYNELKDETHAFSAVTGQGNNLSSGNQTPQLDNLELDKEFNHDGVKSITSLSREQKPPNLEGFKGDDREGSTRRNSTGSLQRITLKILNPNVGQHSNKATNSDLNSVLLDIDAPVVLHSRYRTTLTNAVGKDSIVQTDRPRTIKFERSITEHKGISTDNIPLRPDNLYRSSSVDLDSDKHTERREASVSVRDESRDVPDLFNCTIVPYSSSSEDLDETTSFVPRKHPAVVRFEDEGKYAHSYDDEPISSYCDKMMETWSRNRNQHRRSTGIKTFSSLEDFDRRFSDGRVKDDGHVWPVYESSCADATQYESAHLLSKHEKPRTQSSNILAARTSSYYGDDESDQPGALC